MTTKARAIPSPLSAEPALPGATFRDSFALSLAGHIVAREAAERALGRSPGWVDKLMSLRNALVAPFGLKHGPDPAQPEKIGFFPIVSETSDRIVLGFDDKHLDFRIVVDAEPQTEDVTRVVATTLVKTNNLFGRAYLAAILPFHRMIVPAMLNQAAR